LNIIITLAGKSSRFFIEGYKKDKFLLYLDKDNVVLNKTVNMFSNEDIFHFIINKKQARKNKNLENFLKNITRKNFIHIIDEHDKGPAFSAINATNIDENEPIIISYCDFFVNWNYKKFIRATYNYDGLIPAFRGFHPSSYTGTLYAYLKINKNKELLGVREKKSYTKNPVNEFASCGIYYFKSFKLYKKYTGKLLKKTKKESYISLVYNDMIKDDLKTGIFEVDNFICLGTPKDYRNYLHWSKYFKVNKKFNASIPNNGTNLIPMSGEGMRFKKYGYRVSKPLIQINSKPMLYHVCNTFPKPQSWIFVIRSHDNKNNRIRKLISNMYRNSQIVELKKLTRGPAETCMYAENLIDMDKPLFISSCDYLTFFDEQKWKKIHADQNIDGAIWTYRLDSITVKSFKAFAYCKVDNNNLVQKISEKKVISKNPEKDLMLVGSFWFRKAKVFFENYRESKKKRYMVNNEYYVGNNINLAIEKKLKFINFNIDQWISLGDPFELQLYEYWNNFFQKDSNEYK
jgi:dTDP-glucose pyrophosphorylase|tara:strand:- start:916 stop:2463 length:1548 start_codon:yes stop_codon:yes gene_type:complete